MLRVEGLLCNILQKKGSGIEFFRSVLNGNCKNEKFLSK